MLTSSLTRIRRWPAPSCEDSRCPLRSRPSPLPASPSPERAPPGLRYLTNATMRALFDFSPDMAPVAVELNRLNNQMLVRYYEEEWQRWAR